MNSKNTVDESTQRITQAARSMSPAQESKSTSSASSSSSSSSPPPDNARNSLFNFPLPTTIDKNKSTIKSIVDIIPPSLVNFDQESNNDEEDEEDDTSASFFSKRNATAAQLNSLKTIDHIVQGDITPRTRTTVQNPSNSGARNLPVEYDDESMSQSISHSIISSVDDITVDKTSANAANIDFLEDF